MRNIRLLERLLAPTQVGFANVVVDFVQIFWKSIQEAETDNREVRASKRACFASHMDVDAHAMTKGGKKGGTGKNKSSKPEKFGGKWYWCGSCGHVMEDCRKKAAGTPRVTQTPRRSDPKPKGKGKGGKGKKGASSSDDWLDETVRKLHRLARKLPRRLQVSLSMLSADTRGTVNETG